MYESDTVSKTICEGIFGNSVGMKEDFGRVVRRIVYSNSGSFMAIGADGQPIRERQTPHSESFEWRRCKEQAEAAARRGNLAQAEMLWLHALAEAKHFDKSDFRLAYTLDNMASLYFTIGHFEQAEMFCSQSLAALIQIYGPTHVRVANCMNNLAGIYYSQKRFQDSEPLSVRVLHIYEGAFGPDHADVGMVVNNLAMLFHSIGEFDQARKMYERALRIRSRALGAKHPIVLILQQNYANLIDAMSVAQNQDITSSSLLAILLDMIGPAINDVTRVA